MILIFCSSNLFIPITLSLIKEHENSQVLLFVDQEGIREFFSLLKLRNVEMYFVKKILFSVNPFKLRLFYKNRNLILSNLRMFKFNKIFFFHLAFGELENWLIFMLSKKSKIFHCPVTGHIPFKEKKSIKSTLQSLKSRLIYNTEVITLWTGKRYISYLSPFFVQKINAKKKVVLIDNQFIDKLVFDLFHFESINDIVLLTGANVELGLIDKNEYKNKIDNLIRITGIKRILAKQHPRYLSLFSLENDLLRIPYIIPANMLFSKFKIFIGYNSAVLIEAANNGLLSISLIDYFVPTNIESRELYKNYLLNNLINGIIYFPKNIDSIKSLVNRNLDKRK